MTPQACSRMYNLTPSAQAAWAGLFARLSEVSGLALEVLDYPPPAPLETLWDRPDLACVFMCGWPFSRRTPQPPIIAVPIPAAPRYGGRPVYFTDLVVHRDAAYRSLEDTFGGRIGWTVTASHSGFNAPRHHLLPHWQARGRNLYRESHGPLVTPLGAVQSVARGIVDIAPVDSYALELLTRHAPETVADIRILDHTAPAPFPPLVCSPELPEAARTALRRALTGLHLDARAAPLLRALGLSGFTGIAPKAYDIAQIWADAAVNAGYPAPT